MQNVIETIKQKQGTLLDVRSPMEFETEHVPGAVNFPLDTIESNLKNIGISLAFDLMPIKNAKNT